MEISKNEEFKEGSSGCEVEWGIETIPQQDGTANLFRHVFFNECENSLRNTGFICTALLVFWLAVHCGVVSLHPAGPYIKMKLENTEMKLS